MECPHCKQEVRIPDNARRNVDTYGGVALVTTLCCGRAVYLRQKRSFDISPYDGDRKEDDWGRRIRRWNASKFNWRHVK